MIDQTCLCFGHPPGFARGTHAATLAGVGDQEIVLALVAVSSGETVGENAAFEIAAKCPLDIGRPSRNQITGPSRSRSGGSALT